MQHWPQISDRCFFATQKAIAIFKATTSAAQLATSYPRRLTELNTVIEAEPNNLSLKSPHSMDDLLINDRSFHPINAIKNACNKEATFFTWRLIEQIDYSFLSCYPFFEQCSSW